MSYSRIDLIILFTAAEWAASDLILHTYEAGMESDTGKIKQGNGIDVFPALSYIPGTGGGGGGGDLLAANNLSDVANAATSLANLGGQPAGSYLTSEVDPDWVAWLAGPPNVSELTNDAGYLTSETAQTLNDVLVAGNTTGGADIVVSAGDTLTVPTAGLKILDINASHSLTISYETDLATDRTLSIFTGDANRALTIAGTASITGTNTGDQTSIVGLTGTKAEFDTAVTDGNFLYVGDVSQKLYVIAQSGATATATNTLAEEVLAAVLIPAGTLGNNDPIRAWALFDAAGGAAGNRIFRIRLHTASSVGGTVYQQATLGTGGGGYSALARIQMKNASNSQEGFGQIASVFGTGSNVVTSALSTGSDMYVLFTSLKVSSGTDNAALRNYTVERIIP